MTAKQLKKLQSQIETDVPIGKSIVAFWGFKDSLENEKTFSAKAEVTENNKDHLLARLMEKIQEQHHIELYPANWIVYIPKTNNNSWNINNRFEFPSPSGRG